MPIETIFAGAAGWIISNYGQTLAEKAARTAWKNSGMPAWEKWQQDNRWEKALADYQAAIRYNHGQIQIIGQTSPTPLEGIFTDVYLLDKPTALHRYDVESLHEEFEESARRFGSRWRTNKQIRHNGLDLVRRPENDRLFILGKPGAGKTTFLKYIALQADSLDKVPIFITLKSWSTSGQTLAEFIATEFRICHFPQAQPFIEYILQTGQALVLFDGLDEVNRENDLRRRIVDEIENFSRSYNHSRMLLTCRIAASEHAFGRFTYVELADFTQPQIDTFVNKWFRAAPEKLEAFRREFYHKDNEGLHELAATPILLALLCLAFEDTMTFAHQRAELYEDAIDALLRRWDSERSIKRDEVYKGLTLKRKQRLFAHLAAGSFEKGAYFFPQRQLERQIEGYLGKLPQAPDEIDGRAVLKSIQAQHSILVERAKEIYSFSHLTFQEYFTARYIAENKRYGMLMRYLSDDRWREVFLLTASQVDQADDFFKTFRTALDGLLADDPTLVELLRWATYKSENNTISSANTPLLRTIYIFLFRAINLAPDRAHARAVAHALDSDRVLDYALDLDLDFDLNVIRALNINYKLALASVLNLGSPAALDYMLTFGLQSSLLIESIYKKNYLIRAQIGNFTAYFAQMSQEAAAVSAPLATALAGLTVPDKAAPQTAWREFNRQLRGIMLEQRDLGRDWDLSNEQANTLADYLQASRLLLDCLAVAYVDDREAIKNSLLLPPGQWDF